MAWYRSQVFPDPITLVDIDMDLIHITDHLRSSPSHHHLGEEINHDDIYSHINGVIFRFYNVD